MKKIYIVMMALFAISISMRAQTVSINGNQFNANGKQIWFNGINTPWNNWADFGGNFVQSWWTGEFQKYVDNKINLARVWIHCEGSNSPTTNSDGSVTGASAQFWSNMDTLVSISRAKKVYVLPCLWSFDMVKNSNQATYQKYRNLINSQANIQTYITNFLIPLVKRYINEPYVMGWEISNEPEWMFENAEDGPIPVVNVQRLHAMCAAAIHKNCSKPVTTGSACVKWNSYLYQNSGDNAGNVWGDTTLQRVYNDPQAKLDFWEIHWYPWMSQWFQSPYQKTSVAFQIDDKPVLVGESQGMDQCDTYICQTLVQMYENAYLNGFDGVCGWKTPQNDGYGTFENIAVATNTFYNKHPQLVYPTGTVVSVATVTVTPTKATVGIGATTTLVATVIPSNATNKSVTWSTSNAAIATVSSTGVVTGVALGSATITVTTVDGAKTATCTVTVSNVPVTGVTVSPTTASIAIGGTSQLTATVLPANATNKNVTWKSSNTAVATVSSTGLVTGVAAGTATITVTTVDGAKAATCAVTVTNVPVTSVSVNPTTASLAIGATTLLTATVLPANATNKSVTWTTSNAAFATVGATGLVTGVAAGTATITVTTVDGAKTATCSVTVGSTSCSFGTPLATALPTLNASYNKVYVLGTGPNLSNVTNCTINWDLSQNGLWQLSFNTNNGVPTWWIDLRSVATWKFNQVQPEITFTNSGFTGLNGAYWVTKDGSNLVLVSKTGGFTIYFSNSATAPVCTKSAKVEPSDLVNGQTAISVYPNPFTNKIALQVSNAGEVKSIIIANQLGSLVKVLDASKFKNNQIEFGEELPAGIYLIKVRDKEGTKTFKVIKK